MKINNIFLDAQKYNRKMLSEYPAEFWSEYRTNSDNYDRIFRRMYKSWDCPFASDSLEFQYIWFDHLLMNEKKYSELYRVHVVTDTEDPLTYNYDMTETMDRKTNNVTDNMYGNQTITNKHESAPYTDTIGKQKQTVESPEIKSSDKKSVYVANDGQKKPRELSESITEPNNVVTTADSYTNTHGEENVTDTNIISSKSDTIDSDGTEKYTLIRKGNIGVQTATDMLRLHLNLWSVYEFYQLIFKDFITQNAFLVN